MRHGAVALWMDNEHGNYVHWRQQAEECYRETDEDDRMSERRTSARSTLADRIQEVFESDSPLTDQASVYSDLLTAALGSVDWYEIAEHLLEEITQPEDPSLDIIDSYSRADAIEDGVMIDASEMAKEAGLKFPVAITATVWDKYVEVPEGVEGQDEQGRLWDLLNMLLFAIKRGCEGSELLFTVLVNNDGEPKPIQLKSICGPGDDADPVITIMLPNED